MFRLRYRNKEESAGGASKGTDHSVALTDDSRPDIGPASSSRKPARWLSMALVFVIVPAAFFFVGMQLTKASGPAWIGVNFENSYPYLFNSLLLLEGKSPYSIYHPGTTTQLFGAAVLRLSDSGSRHRVVQTVLDNPEKSIKRIQRAMLICTALCLWLFPWLTGIYLHRYVTALLIQIPTLFFATVLLYSIWFGSDLMLVPFCVGALCLCLILMRQRWEGYQRIWTVLLAGAACALGIVTKLTFFPWLFFLLACCFGVKNRLLLAGSFVVTGAIALVPIYSRLTNLYGWIVGIATHTGQYGSGDPGFIRVDSYLPTFWAMLQAEPMMAWIPAISTLAVILFSVVTASSFSQIARNRFFRTGIGLFFVQLISCLLVAKHPDPHYFIPTYLSVGLNLALLFEFSREKSHPTLLRAFSGVTLAALLGWALHDAAVAVPATYHELADQRAEHVALYKRVLRKVPENLRVDYYRAPTPRFAECFGDDFAGGSFAQFLEKKYPNTLFYNIFTSRFDTFGSSFSREEILKKYDHLYFFGTRNIPVVPNFDATHFRELDADSDYHLDEWKRE